MMTRQNRKLVSAVVSVIAVGFIVSGCGKRGALEAPPSDRVVTTDSVGNTINKPAPKPDRPFILDGLI
ncbi:MAG: hypothetical protein L3J32_10375 [Rhizobiaceae bacterium]|nr:hypothetical protein [Rhizobiaceae bacterium]